MEALPIVWKTPDPEEYEKARTGRLFNLRRPKRFPLAIVKASREAHVILAVKLAIEKACRVSIRSGGHSWAAWSVRDNAILVDFGDYHELELDEQTGIVRVSTSTTSAELNAYLLDKGRMFSGGHCGDVAVGCFILQAGFGWCAAVFLSRNTALKSC
jgi:FAD/FMN-containing dehydrogenase